MPDTQDARPLMFFAYRMLMAFDQKSLGIRNPINFDAKPSRPTCSLSTFLSRPSPDER